MEFQLGQHIKMKKTHPCGKNDWEILRVGMDFRLKCSGCGHMIMIPRKDTVLFAPAGNKDIVEKMIDHGEKAYEQGENKISKKLLMFLREGKELITYEN